MVVKKCLTCKKEILNDNEKYCSKECHNKSRRGKTWEEIFGVERAKEMKEKKFKKVFGKNLSFKHRQKISEALKKIIHTPERNLKISNTLMGHTFSEETKKKISKTLTGRYRGRDNPCFGRSPSPFAGHGKCGKRKDLNNQYFRSTWEANFARILNYWKIPWVFEPTMFDLGDCAYRPDFKIFDSVGEYFVEVIGYFDGVHKKKLKLFQEKYPNEKIQIVKKETYKDLQNEFKNKIENWEV